MTNNMRPGRGILIWTAVLVTAPVVWAIERLGRRIDNRCTCTGGRPCAPCSITEPDGNPPLGDWEWKP